ncbi:dipeptidase AC. Metallo peptidase. MEROPS family M19 [Gemmobacter megaterium]|uniref:Dipeptidase AC. Metallo peptidase. MEROPS family M19 n=1 Tax=Gemmobacter megaterium TaxID=1086013 RepID=A0A1N7JXL9_9RHOB|nr:dipeptidase [Gemmobacter megaterium]GGD99520.1 membrane dipeptidase [Gemmobacter megaterium]SIS54078.1 dipeptidase AC. Metallo peptidase. MEROPS family M19 [Gemmobacter megaterium]
MTQAFPIFDGHNDLLLHLHASGDRGGDSFVSGREGHLDLEKCRAGGFAGGFFAIYVPPEDHSGSARTAPVSTDRARKVTLEMAGILLRLTRAHPDAIRLCTTADQIETARKDGAIAALMHIEGAEGIGPELGELEVLHAAGLRSLGPVWSRPNIFGHGVPFAWPASPDIGPGLTEAGLRLVAECERLGILIDLSHLNEAGFWDVARLSSRPLVATHSCVHALSAQSRNLTDRQLSAIAESDGLVGLNFGCQFLREDGQRRDDTDLSVMVRHLAYLVERLGETGVALGSDFDGALMPRAIGTAAGLPALVEAMQQAGFGAPLIQRICWQNWIDLLRRSIG